MIDICELIRNLIPKVESKVPRPVTLMPFMQNVRLMTEISV